ncbi:MAG: hypothetical protein PHC85_03150 [Candidatus Pacebacteria bacterium]|nr:hypothetical protein [Candidatus Paceibacterota bacterium]
MPPNTLKSKASQEFVPIKEIRNGVVILNDGSLRIVLMASSINFALKSADEQEAIILQYQNFLNSLDFTAQFFIESRGLNIEPYLDTLRARQQEITDELLMVQSREYIEFVKEFVSANQIVNKTFYVVVPYSPSMLEEKGGSFLNTLKNIFGKQKKEKTLSQENFEENKLQLQQRVETVIQGLSRAGVRSAPLNTEELIELFYGLYNPGEGEKAKIPELEQDKTLQ